MSSTHAVIGVIAGVAIGSLATFAITSGSKKEAAEEVKSDALVLDTSVAKTSYALGSNIGRQFKNQELDYDIEIMTRAIRDNKEGNDLLMTEDDIRQAMTELQQSQREKMMARRKAQEEEQAKAGEMNKKKGEEWLAKNKEKEGVVTTESGLQYKILRPGTGPKPTADSKVEVHYRGTLIDGTEFDSSYKRGQPTSFNVSGVVAGWTEGLQLMKEGAKWELYLPSELAYGERAAGEKIGPNSTLVFEVELLKANKSDEEAK